MGSFLKDIQPLLKLMQLFGLHFQFSEKLSIKRSFYFLRIYGAICLLLNISWHSYSTARFLNWSPRITLSTVNNFVDYFNFMLNITGSHVAMYLMTFGGLHEAHNSIQRLERVLGTQYNHKLRHSSWMAVAFVVSFVTTQLAVTVYNRERIKNWDDLLSLLLSDLGHAYPMMSYCLFFVSALALALHFQHVNSKLACYLERESKNSGELDGIRANHGLVCQAVDQLNGSFQTLSFIHVVFAFIGIVNTSFMLMTKSYFSLKIVPYHIESVARLGLLGYICDRVQSEALACLKTLANTSHVTGCSLLHQQQHVMFGGQILQTVPKFDVYGLFHLSRQLLPHLVGTTITYSVILYQFKAP
ncbi:hypothetical protein GHT06_009676 [Daphnia sinensis]|uniref:Gustatory receptor n=1 Tax=Daphnia sinensis TaxID=1820382 RepID=A0AAD5LXE5_9CRUS|nr:hypothetical protein GHT06_009676 [Daphnia sinensis]